MTTGGVAEDLNRSFSLSIGGGDMMSPAAICHCNERTAGRRDAGAEMG
jgi:hypothetical protein